MKEIIYDSNVKHLNELHKVKVCGSCSKRNIFSGKCNIDNVIRESNFQICDRFK